MTPHRATAVPALALPPHLWQEIARGTPRRDTLDLLRRARAGRNLLLLRALHRELRGGHRWTAATELLATVRRDAPAVFGGLIAGPVAGTVLADAVRGRGPGAVPALAATAAHLARVPFRLDLPVHGGALILPGLGQATVGAAARTALVVGGPAGTTVRVPGARLTVPVPEEPERPVPGWRAVPCLRLTAHEVHLTVRLDSGSRPWPRAAHPLTPADHERWSRRLAAAWERLVTRHPDRARTVGGTVRVVVPLEEAAPGPRRDGGWSSASFSDAVGLVALAPVEDPAELAAALVHETQHSLLYALQDLTPLLDAPRGAYGPAPWSDRPRPPAALLQGIGAFLVTAGFWRDEARLGHRPAAASYERWRNTAGDVAEQLVRRGWLTGNGRLFLDAVRDVLAEWEAGPPAEAGPRVEAGPPAAAGRPRSAGVVAGTTTAVGPERDR
ncbi:HEXXH motif-containing putative peptide modification protein [Streptomyces sp. Caat 7-52]|uniref:aKG-HExxH-type peptide beta-hydroxylase n=1 Tax=Streptomyces sp. Caat 7-52 TaxID=2949637 RepID=UPI002034D609|nr:HEXXH motif-containing putative peptide modification protein [Streptomyces sp. Caat 7-52]